MHVFAAPTDGLQFVTAIDIDTRGHAEIRSLIVSEPKTQTFICSMVVIRTGVVRFVTERRTNERTYESEE